jgi:uncharacterized glyoxalase superfamily protein PhnB
LTFINGVALLNRVSAIAFICAVYQNDDGAIAHAQLTLGQGMIMLGSVLGKETEWSSLIKQADEIDGKETHSPYMIVADADVIYNRAKAAGEKIVVEIKDEDYGGRGFSCYDLEGHLGNFGTYDPG